MLHTHPDRLERWLGKEKVESVSRQMRDFYWPIALHGVPGHVFAMPGGDFTGEIRAGSECSAVDRAAGMLNRYARERRAQLSARRIGNSRGLLHGLDRRQHAFSSLSAIVAAQTGGKGQFLTFAKTGVASNSAGSAMDLWTRPGQPAAGAAGAAAPGGTSPTSATTGALGYVNPANANTGHFTTGFVSASIQSNSLLLYDRLFSVAKTMASTATEAVSGTFARYQNTVAGNEDYVGGNFCFPSVPTTVLAATGHSWTVCQYTDQGGNVTQNFQSIVGQNACVVGGIDLAANSWFIPLAAGDTGVKALTQMQCNASVATGTVDFVVGHPIAFFPCPVASMICPMDGIYTAFNLQRIYDNACLAFLEMPKPATSVTTYSGTLQIVAE